MPATAPLEELEAVQRQLNLIKEKFPDAFDQFKQLFKKHRGIGYKNISKMLLGEATPKELKGLE